MLMKEIPKFANPPSSSCSWPGTMAPRSRLSSRSEICGGSGLSRSLKLKRETVAWMRAEVRISKCQNKCWWLVLNSRPSCIVHLTVALSVPRFPPNTSRRLQKTHFRTTTQLQFALTRHSLGQMLRNLMIWDYHLYFLYVQVWCQGASCAWHKISGSLP